MINIFNSKKNKQRLGIILAILLAFLFTTLVVPSLFIAGSPQINTEFIAQFRQNSLNLIGFVRREQVNNQYPQVDTPSQTNTSFKPDFTPEDYVFTASIPKVEHPPGLAYRQIAKGVQAAEDPNTKKTYIKIDKGTRLEEREVTLDDGRTVIVYIPLE